MLWVLRLTRIHTSNDSPSKEKQKIFIKSPDVVICTTQWASPCAAIPPAEWAETATSCPERRGHSRARPYALGSCRTCPTAHSEHASADEACISEASFRLEAVRSPFCSAVQMVQENVPPVFSFSSDWWQEGARTACRPLFQERTQRFKAFLNAAILEYHGPQSGFFS